MTTFLVSQLCSSCSPHGVRTRVYITSVHQYVCAVGVGFTVAERVLFLPSVGICLLLGVVATEVQLS